MALTSTNVSVGPNSATLLYTATTTRVKVMLITTFASGMFGTFVIGGDSGLNGTNGYPYNSDRDKWTIELNNGDTLYGFQGGQSGSTITVVIVAFDL